MKAFFKYIQGLAIKMIIKGLKENEVKVAKHIASKVDIPLLGEAQEAELAKKLIAGFVEVLEDIFESDAD